MSRHEIPFRSQYWNLKQWKQLGFASESDAEYWQRSCCGILCLGMVMDKVLNTPTSNKELIDQGVRLGAYSDSVGWSHDGLISLAKLYGLWAARREKVSQSDMQEFLDTNKVFIASIKWAFVPTKSLIEKIPFRRKKGGHLALVTGYNDTGFIVHHTSIRENYNWVNQHIPFENFKKGFTGRGIVVLLNSNKALA